MRFIVLLILLLSLTACSNPEDTYFEGYVTDRDKKSVDVELVGATSHNSKNITVKVENSEMLSQVDEGENILVKCNGINWWSNPPEAEAITLETISFDE
ncbi:hypothetical protein [Robertmurraya korlensis]|uniref:hypothetical protein n=1 Tax=Robertmurraya korlensis TaxID=519977 RepID=UPI000824F6C8|nr:hypothetical protein [Robertmurraya korlensis]